MKVKSDGRQPGLHPRKGVPPTDDAPGSEVLERGPCLAVPGLKFRRQHPIGPYILDFYCAAARLAVEIDGATHADPDQARHDMVRTKWLAGRGIRVIRIAARDVRDEFDGVLRYLKDVITDRLAEADAAPS